jgi:hypothetical protein
MLETGGALMRSCVSLIIYRCTVDVKTDIWLFTNMPEKKEAMLSFGRSESECGLSIDLLFAISCSGLDSGEDSHSGAY